MHTLIFKIDIWAHVVIEFTGRHLVWAFLKGSWGDKLVKVLTETGRSGLGRSKNPKI